MMFTFSYRWQNMGVRLDKKGILVGTYFVCRIVILGIMRVTEKVILINYKKRFG